MVAFFFSFNLSSSSSFSLPLRKRSSRDSSAILCFYRSQWKHDHHRFPPLQPSMNSSSSSSSSCSAAVTSLKRGTPCLNLPSFHSLIFPKHSSGLLGSDSRVTVLKSQASARMREEEEEEEEEVEEKYAHLRKHGFRTLKTDEEIHFEALEHYFPDYEESDIFASSMSTLKGSMERKLNSEKTQTHGNVAKFSFNGNSQEDEVRAEWNITIAKDGLNGSLNGNQNEKNRVEMNKIITKDNINGSLDFNQEDNINVEINKATEKDILHQNLNLNQDQKIRAELNKAIAIARRNSHECNHNVLDSRAQGLPFPKFESLLVEKSWAKILGGEFEKPYMERLYRFLSQEAAANIPIYPPSPKIFNSFNSCPFDKVKVVIIGQDPYHKQGQAMGLCFSVETGMKFPSSLANIFLEIESDLKCEFPSHGNLEKWVYQGVLLMNTVLTVRDGHANSHAKKGWELFTDAAIRALAQQRSGLIFLLWGNSAQEKIKLINRTSHHILTASHPSGHSARKGFFNCRHFSKTNEILVNQGLLPIDWQL